MNLNGATFITSASSEKQFIKSEKPIIAVVGKSNVGKSSFINMLAGQKKLARTSDTPGRTRLVNYFDFGEFLLADLPGYGYAKVSKAEKDKWAVEIDKFFTGGNNADFVFVLTDIRREPSTDDEIMLNFLHNTALPFTVILTKSDKLTFNEQKKQIKQIANFFAITENDLIVTSAVTNNGKEKVIDKIINVINVLDKRRF